jgi:uncharacterized protein with beta-barrel porin domain
MYSADPNTSLVIPYLAGPLNYKNDAGTYSNRQASLDIQVSGVTIPVTIDTGSTGIAISKAILLQGNPDALKNATNLGPGAYNYDSSGATPTGTFYEMPVSILGTVNGKAAVGTTTVKLLVVENDDTTRYFGIGNNRNNAYSPSYSPTAKPIVPAGMNPLLNVSVNGTALTNQGYVVMNDKIVVGLSTANNTYTFVKLTPDAATPPAANLWNQIPAAFSHGTGNPYTTGGQILQDTGIFNGYLKPLPQRGDTVDVSVPGIPGLPKLGAFYTFVLPPAGSSCPSAAAMQPCDVQGSTADFPFLNTGRQFYAGFNYLFDPINGYAGYALSSSGLTTAAQLVPVLALQGTVPLQNGFATDLPTALFAATTLTTQAGGTATFNGTFTGYGNSLTVAGAGNVVFNGPVDLATGGGTFTVSSGALATTNGGLTAAGVVIASQGALTNTATITANVTNSGTLTNNGTIQGNVTNSGLLNGNSIIVGDLVNTGTLSPGNSIGTIIVSGSLLQVAGGAHLADVSAQRLSDKILVSGTTTIQGGTVSVAPAPGVYAPSTTYTFLTSERGVNGTYTSVTSSNPFLQPSLSYDAKNVYLTLQIGGFAAAAQTPTQAAVGAALDAGAPGATGDFATILGTLANSSTSQVLPFLTSISGQNYSAFSNSMVQGAQLFMNNFALQVGGGSIGPRAPGGGAGRVALAEACTTACQVFTPPTWGAWGGALGGTGTVGTGTVGTGTSAGSTTYNVGGFAAGLDRLLAPNFLAGVTVGYTTGTQWVSGFSGQSSSNTVQVGLYGSFFEGPAYVDGMVSYAYSTNQMWRNIAIPNLQQRTAQGLTGANQFFGQIEGGYRITFGGTALNAAAMPFITPFARLQGYTGTQNAFTETGAQSLSLSVAAQTTNSLRSVIGAQLGGSMDFGWRDRLYAQLRLGWSHEYADVTRPVTASLAGAPSFLFTTYGATPTRDGAVVGLQMTTEVAQASSIYLRYEGNIAGNDTTHALTAGLRMTW